MEKQVHYATVTDAINKLRQQRFIIDFNIVGDYLVCPAGQVGPDEFEIVDVYRYEGDTDPADEAVVYAIESKHGLKGVLVTGYGIYTDTISSKILEKLNNRK